jgi:hypothetical protein
LQRGSDAPDASQVGFSGLDYPGKELGCVSLFLRD